MIDTIRSRTYTARVQDRIIVGDDVSWKRSFDDRRIFGYVVQVGRGFCVVKSNRGIRFAVRTRDLTKECR